MKYHCLSEEFEEEIYNDWGGCIDANDDEEYGDDDDLDISSILNNKEDGK